MYLKKAYAKWREICLGLNVLIYRYGLSDEKLSHTVFLDKLSKSYPHDGYSAILR